MKKILSKAKDFFDKYKKEKWFRYLAVITILIIFAAVVSAIDDFRDQEEKPPDTEETSIVSDFFEDSAVHRQNFPAISVHGSDSIRVIFARTSITARACVRWGRARRS